MTPERPKVTERGRYSPTQVAEILGISRTQVYRLTDQGKLTYTLSKGNNRRVYSGRTIINYWNNN